MGHHLLQGDLGLAAPSEFRQVVGDLVHERQPPLLDERPHRRTGQHLGLAEQQEQGLAGRRLFARLGPGVAIAAVERQLPVPRQRDLRARIAPFLDMLADQPVEVLQRLGGEAERRGVAGGQRIAVGHGGLLWRVCKRRYYMTGAFCGRGMRREPASGGSGWHCTAGGGTLAQPIARPQERPQPGSDREAAPKEQPPRKLSGKRTAGGRALWKAAGGSDRVPHRRSKPGCA